MQSSLLGDIDGDIPCIIDMSTLDIDLQRKATKPFFGYQ